MQCKIQLIMINQLLNTENKSQNKAFFINPNKFRLLIRRLTQLFPPGTKYNVVCKTIHET